MTKHISKTLIIGLGGTGQRVIHDIKKSMLRTYGEMPPLVELLAFDTDNYQADPLPFRYYCKGECHEDYKYHIETSEFCRMEYPPFELIEHYPICSEKLNMEELHKLYGLYGSHGCPSRLMGRACLLYNSQKIITRLTAAITNLRLASLTIDAIASGYCLSDYKGITVYVIASLAGGTGSSALMDISRMLQVAGLNVKGFDVPTDCIYGMFFTPSFFEGMPGAENVCVNAYAALSELDYTMGLADPTRYAIGCRELKDDRNDYAGYPNDKRVEYMGVYLIDAFSTNGQVHTIEEVSQCVASYITCSMASNQNIGAHFCVSAHKWHDIDGKYQNYSGLGYCELRFNRQELVRYLLNRKLITGLETYKCGDSRIRAIQIAESFIHDYNLNEGVMTDSQGEDTRPFFNDLTDAIIARYDRELAKVSMQEVDPGRDAAHNIAVSKTSYLAAIGSTIKEIVHSFADEKEALLQKLKTMLNEQMTGKGFGTFPDLVHCLRTMFNDMKDGLKDEITQHEKAFCEIENELHHIQEEIADCYASRLGSVFGRKREAQMQAIQRYCKKVGYDIGSEQYPTLAWLKVETARKREAVAIYEEMISIAESYYKEETIETVNGLQIHITGSYLAVDGMYHSLMNLLFKETDRYRPSKFATCASVYADAYFKDYFDKHEWEFQNLDYKEERFENYLKTQFDNPMITDSCTLAEMRQSLLGFFPEDNLVRKIQEEQMSIDELFIHCFGKYGDIMSTRDLDANPQLGLLSQIDTKLDMLLQRDHFFRGQGLEPYRTLFVGVYDSDHSIFNKGNGYDSILYNRCSSSIISNHGDLDRITFMLWEIGIPGHKLKGVENWAKEYDRKKGYIYAFSDRRLENIEMIMPETKE